MIDNDMRKLTLMLCLVAGIFGGSVTAFAGVAQEAESKSAGVSLVAPEDGGTPRDKSRIVAVGPGEFRIRACVEESNVHQYAMKRYGTQVWGWEMPWWGRDVDAARRAGADFGRAFLATIDIMCVTVSKLP